MRKLSLLFALLILVPISLAAFPDESMNFTESYGYVTRQFIIPSSGYSKNATLYLNLSGTSNHTLNIGNVSNVWDSRYYADYTNISHGFNLGSTSAGDPDTDGINVTANLDIFIINVSKSALSTANTSYIIDVETNRIIANATFIENQANVNVWLKQGKKYYILAGRWGALYTLGYTAGVTYPISNEFLNFTATVRTSNFLTYTSPINTQIYNIQNLTLGPSAVPSNYSTVISTANMVNGILSAGCACQGCVEVGPYCYINYNFYSSGIDTINMTGNLSYVNPCLDACTNSCNIPSNITAINFTGKYENNQSVANISASGTIDYYLTGVLSTTTLYPSITNYENFQYCTYPSWAQINLDYDITYSLFGDTITRTRSDTGLTVGGTITTVPLYVLNTLSSGTIRFRIVDTYSNPISGAVVTATRNIAGVDYIVQIAVSDSAGMAYLFLDTTAQYTITASKTGYTSSTNTIIPTTTDMYTLFLTTTTSGTKSYSAGITYMFQPEASRLPRGEYDFIFNLTSSFYNVSMCTLYLANINTTIYAQNSSSFTNTTCDIRIRFQYDSNYTLFEYSVVEFDHTINITYHPIFGYVAYNYSNFTIMTVVRDMKNFADAGFGWQTKMMLALIIICAITFGVSYRFQSVVYNPEIIIILFLVLVWIVSWLNWLSVGELYHINVANGTLSIALTSLTQYVQQYSIALVTTLLGGVYIWQRNR